MAVLDAQHPDVQKEVAGAAAGASRREFCLFGAAIHLVDEHLLGGEEEYALLIHPDRAGLAIKALQAEALLQARFPPR